MYNLYLTLTTTTTPV